VRGLSLGGGWVIRLFQDGTRIQCNHVGVTGPGSDEHANLLLGVVIEGLASGVVVGTDGDGVGDVGERNVFAGEFSFGVYVNGNDDNRISGNTFGLAADGVTPLDCSIGVYIRQNSERNLIGILEDAVSDDLEPNHLAQCGSAIWLEADANASANAVVGNRIGLDVSGGTPGNEIGLRFANDALAYQIQGNLIAGNFVGLRVEGTPGFAATDGNCFLDNDTGLEHAGAGALAFEDNFWGAADGPSGAGPGSGDPVAVTGSGSLDFDPWLSACPVPEPTGGLAATAAAAALAALRSYARTVTSRATATPGPGPGAPASRAPERAVDPRSR
jgi:hypothetical protein